MFEFRIRKSDRRSNLKGSYTLVGLFHTYLGRERIDFFGYVSHRFEALLQRSLGLRYFNIVIVREYIRVTNKSHWAQSQELVHHSVAADTGKGDQYLALKAAGPATSSLVAAASICAYWKLFRM